jgi:hypothetical protein
MHLILSKKLNENYNYNFNKIHYIIWLFFNLIIKKIILKFI